MYLKFLKETYTPTKQAKKKNKTKMKPYSQNNLEQ